MKRKLNREHEPEAREGPLPPLNERMKLKRRISDEVRRRLPRRGRIERNLER